MRQVFTSPRVENVERVAELLREQDIEVRITNGRSYRSKRRGNFSYREGANSGPNPAVWVIRSEDQPKARELLRGIGLLETGRSQPAYLPTPELGLRAEAAPPKPFAKRVASRIKLGLLIGMGIIIVMAIARVM